MCGRFVLATKPSTFVDRLREVEAAKENDERFLYSEVELDNLFNQALELDKEVDERYNIAPRWEIPAIARVDDGPLTIGTFKWGLLPPWAKDPKMGDRCFNARSETAAEKPMFRSAFKRSRCAVLADGYYEWKKLDAKTKQPYYIHRNDGDKLYFAGLCEPSTMTSTIMTTAAEDQMIEIHDRRPVFLTAEEVGEWLDPRATREELLDVIRASKADNIESYPVSRDVNKAGLNDSSFIEPI